MTTPPAFLGRWSIVETEVWDRDALDMIVPAHITFGRDRLGHFEMIAVSGGLDCRFSGDSVEWSWIGESDGKPSSGRGRARVDDDGCLRGTILFHQGDESTFVARREDNPAVRPPRPAPPGQRRARR